MNTLGPAVSVGRVAASEVVSILESIYGGFQLVDCSFPDLHFYRKRNNYFALNDLSRFTDSPLNAFYSRFRQAGGHQPVLRWQSMIPQQSDENRVVALSGQALVQLATHQPWLLDSHAAYLFSLNGDHPPLSYGDLDLQPIASFDFVRPGGFEKCQLAAFGDVPGFVLERILDAARTFAVDTHCSDGPSGPVVKIQLPEAGHQTNAVAIMPSTFIHDGSRNCESDGEYAWLWIGAERQIRILLGHVSSHFHRIRVSIPKAFSDKNLRGIRLALNGRVVPTSLEVWSEGAGAVTAELSPRVHEELVLSVSAPNVNLAEDGATHLAACIDRIELIA